MSVSAYILVQTENNRSTSVAAAAMKLRGVLSADEAMGSYDVIVKAEAATLEDLGTDVVAKIQMIDGITRTLTCPIVRLGN